MISSEYLAQIGPKMKVDIQCSWLNQEKVNNLVQEKFERNTKCKLVRSSKNKNEV